MLNLPLEFFQWVWHSIRSFLFRREPSCQSVQWRRLSLWSQAEMRSSFNYPQVRKWPFIVCTIRFRWYRNEMLLGSEVNYKIMIRHRHNHMPKNNNIFLSYVRWNFEILFIPMDGKCVTKFYHRLDTIVIYFLTTHITYPIPVNSRQI